MAEYQIFSAFLVCMFKNFVLFQDAILVHPTQSQAARAAGIIHAAFLFRRTIDRQTLTPVCIS